MKFEHNFFVLKTKNKYILIGSLFMFIGSSCNLFRYGIEERKKQNETVKINENTVKDKSERLKKADVIIRSAKQFEGTPYKLGGDSKKGIDCSALVMLSYKNAGITLPRTSLEQSKVGSTLALKEAQPGDLIFFKFKKSRSGNAVNHVGIVTRNENNGILYFYHASTSLGVMESSLLESYYKEVFVKVSRVY